MVQIPLRPTRSSVLCDRRLQCGGTTDVKPLTVQPHQGSHEAAAFLASSAPRIEVLRLKRISLMHLSYVLFSASGGELSFLVANFQGSIRRHLKLTLDSRRWTEASQRTWSGCRRRNAFLRERSCSIWVFNGWGLLNPLLQGTL